MEPRAHHVFIGLFVVLLGAIGIGFALWLSDTRSDHDYQYYRIMFDEPVTGLRPAARFSTAESRLAKSLHFLFTARPKAGDSARTHQCHHPGPAGYPR